MHAAVALHYLKREVIFQGACSAIGGRGLGSGTRYESRGTSLGEERDDSGVFECSLVTLVGDAVNRLVRTVLQQRSDDGDVAFLCYLMVSRKRFSMTPATLIVAFGGA